jgi:hypothetical protein
MEEAKNRYYNLIFVMQIIPAPTFIAKFRKMGLDLLSVQ